MKSRGAHGISGWVEAALYTIAVGALSLSYAVGHQWGCHSVAFILYAMIVSAIAMLAVTGLGDDWQRIVLAPASLVVGGSIILVEIFYYLVLAYLPPAPGNLMLRIGIPIAMIAGRIYAGRSQPRLAVVGAGIVTLCVVFVASEVDAAARLPAFGFGILAALAFVGRNIASEFHPWNRAAETVMEKIRISGLMVLVTSVMSLLVFAVAAAAVKVGVLPQTRFLPGAADLMHGPTIFLGVIVGALILTAMAYLNFSAVVKITTENVIAMTAFTPVATLAMERAGAAAGLIPAAPLPTSLAIAMAATVAGALIIFLAGRLARR